MREMHLFGVFSCCPPVLYLRSAAPGPYKPDAFGTSHFMRFPAASGDISMKFAMKVERDEQKLKTQTMIMSLCWTELLD